MWITNNYKLNYEELLLRVDPLPLYVSAIEQPTFFSNLLEQMFYSHTIPNPRDTEKSEIYSLVSKKSEPQEPDISSSTK